MKIHIAYLYNLDSRSNEHNSDNRLIVSANLQVHIQEKYTLQCEPIILIELVD